MYHFTNIYCMDGIKKYGLCLGDVSTGFGKDGKRKVGKNGVNLTEEDKLDLSRLSKKLIEDPEVEKYMNGNNTEDNKKNFFKEQFDGMMVDYVNDRFEFYKKMEDNPSMKNLIFNMMYKDFHENRRGDS